MSNIWKPAAFQGRGKKKDYFEGWYFKLVDKDEKSAFAVIPGISISKDPSKSHAFVMLMDARGKQMNYFKHPITDFWADRENFEIKIGKNYFSLQHIQLDASDGPISVKAELNFKSIIQWPVTLASPGVMGWYGFVPGMECYHGVLSFNHSIDGYIEINGEKRDFTGGKGYTEKDWGASMPSSWIWIQSNHFEEDEASLFGSIAKIPWLGSYFTGFIFGFYYKKKVYRFTTYTGARVDRLSVTADKIEALVEDKEYYLEISAQRSDHGVELPVPKLGEMTNKVSETLASRIGLKFYKKTDTGRDLIFSGTGRNAGLEFVGDVNELLKGFRR